MNKCLLLLSNKYIIYIYIYIYIIEENVCFNFVKRRRLARINNYLLILANELKQYKNTNIKNEKNTYKD